MIAVTILIGLIGLGIIIFIHELGHFIGAKACGIQVDTFSLGWGKKLVGFRRGETEYRLALFPLGGYCKMKGEMLRANIDKDEMERMRHEEGSYLAAPPWKRIIVVIAGPLANVVFAVLVLSFLWWVGFSTYSWPNRIIVATDYLPAAEAEVPSVAAGFESGDRIVAMNGVPVESFWDITEMILTNGAAPILCVVERETEAGIQTVRITVTPEIDEESRQPVIGIHSWIEPVVGSVAPDSAAYGAGLKEGDRIVRAGSQSIRHTVDFQEAVAEGGSALDLEVQRGGEALFVSLSLGEAAGDISDQGISWQYGEYRSPRLGFFGSVERGALQSFELVGLTLQGIGQLLRFRFKGLEVAGPIRMTQIMGEAATAGFSFGVDVGFVSFLRILGFISIAIALAQLLPIPILDGGQIVLNIVESIRRKPLAPKFIYGFQIVGFFLILAILVTTIMSDILSFIR